MDEVYEKRGYLLEDFRLFHLKDARGTEIGYHYHEFCKLVLLLSGSGCYTVEGRRYQLKPGDVVLIDSLSVHRPEFEPGISYERLILYISPAFLHAHSTPDCALADIFSGEKGHVLRVPESNRKTLYALGESLERAMSETGYGHELLSRCALLELLVAIGRELSRSDTDLPCPVMAKDSKVLDILRYLDDNLTEDIRIEDLAARFYISKFHMMRRFREETGSSIHAYLSDKRLLLARELIRGGASATDACFQCGFRSYSAFSRAYMKLFGITPTGREGIAVPEEPMNE